MKSSKSIERLFQESFKDFQASPSPKVWRGVLEQIEGKRQRKTRLVFWWQVASVAFILLMFGAIGTFYYNPLVSSSSATSSQVKTEFESAPNTLEFTPAQYRFSSVNDRLFILENSIESSLAFQIQDSEVRNSSANPGVINSIEETRIAARSNSTVNQLKPFSINDTSNSSLTSTLFSPYKETKNKKKSLFDVIENDQPLALETDKPMDKPWTVQPNFAPVFMNSINGGNPIEPSLRGKTSSNPNISYGVNVAYAIHKNIKIRTGVNQVAMGYNTQDVILSTTSSSFRAQSSGQPNLETKFIGEISLLSASTNQNVQARPGVNSAKLSTVGVLNHELGFVEVPFEVEYALIDKKIGLHVLGGASTYVLNNNEIFFAENGRSSSIGEADNLNTFSFSANLGIGMDYNFSDRISLNLEPKFLYQINTFQSNTINFQPYFFGIYSGIKFKF